MQNPGSPLHKEWVKSRRDNQRLTVHRPRSRKGKMWQGPRPTMVKLMQIALANSHLPSDPRRYRQKGDVEPVGEPLELHVDPPPKLGSVGERTAEKIRIALAWAKERTSSIEEEMGAGGLMYFTDGSSLDAAEGGGDSWGFRVLQG